MRSTLCSKQEPLRRQITLSNLCAIDQKLESSSSKSLVVKELRPLAPDDASASQTQKALILSKASSSKLSIMPSLLSTISCLSRNATRPSRQNTFRADIQPRSWMVSPKSIACLMKMRGSWTCSQPTRTRTQPCKIQASMKSKKLLKNSIIETQSST